MEALRQLDGWPVGTATAAVLAERRTGAGTELVGVHGDRSRSLPWASVTKLATAMAVWVAVEEGTLALEDPAGPPGATVAHLLAHASGLGPGGEVLAPPERRRIYSNAGYLLLAHRLEERSGMDFGDYLREAVLAPLGMGGCALDPAGGAAAGLSGRVDDLVALAGELLSPCLVEASTLERFTAAAFPGLVGVLPGFGRQDPCDWGLGPEVRGHKRPHWTGASNAAGTFGHFGRSGGFLWVDPVARVACAVLTDQEFGPWAMRRWPLLSDAVLAEVAGPNVPDVPDVPPRPAVPDGI